MIRLTRNLSFLPVCGILIGMMAGGFLLLPAPAFGEAGVVGIDRKFKGIRISTDQAVIDGKGRQTEFKGHVKVTVDDTKIESDWLSITYRPGMDRGKTTSFTEESIEQITAKGNVKIMFEDKTAVTDQAVYTPHNKTLILTGGNSRITSGKDYIAGDKIILDRIDQTFTVESTGNKQVEAVFSQEKGN
jgi:lipopolysaccharide transport protein LptA